MGVFPNPNGTFGFTQLCFIKNSLSRSISSYVPIFKAILDVLWPKLTLLAADARRCTLFAVDAIAG